MKVHKRNGRKQAFSMAKLRRSVERSAKEAKLAAARRAEMANEIATSVKSSLGRRSVVKATELRKKVLGRLDRRSRKTAQSWRRHDRKRRK